MAESREKTHLLWTDGACKGNPGPGGFGGILLSIEDEVREYGGHVPQTTNNQMEIMAVIQGLELLAETPGPLIICTDSSYVIKGASQWVRSWIKRGWRTAHDEPVKNVSLWRRLHAALEKRKPLGKIEWQHVRGHRGIAGNERADAIASGFGDRFSPKLYQGDLAGYSLTREELSVFGAKTSKTAPQHTNSRASVLRKQASSEFAPPGTGRSRGRRLAERPRGKYYISIVGGRLEHHSTWSECESRVKGVSGARFKKVNNYDEELSTLDNWGFSPSSRDES